MEYSNVKPDEERDIIVSLIVNGGADNGIACTIPGYLITRLETVLAEINEYIDKRDEKLSESDGD